MKRNDIHKANKVYFDWFGDDMSSEALKLAEEIETADDIEQHEEVLSDGEMDAIEAVLLKL